MSDGPTAAQLAYQLANGSDNRGPDITISIVTLTVLSIVFVFLRFITRWMAKLYYWWDDYAIVLALIANQVSMVLAFLGPRFGLGRHEAVVSSEDLGRWGQVIFAFECGYIVCITCTKLSVLLMYSRLFPVSPITRKLSNLDSYSAAWWGLFSFTIIWFITYIFGTIFQCLPVQHFWNRFASSSDPGVCVNVASLYFATFSNILLDIFVLALPVRQVWNLQMRLAQKVAVLSILLVGGFVCVTSIVRVYYIIAVDSSSDLTWTHTDSLIWSCVETSIGIICSCLSTLSPLFCFCLKNVRHRSAPRLGPNFSFAGLPPSRQAPAASGYRASKQDTFRSNTISSFSTRAGTSWSDPSVLEMGARVVIVGGRGEGSSWR